MFVSECIYDRDCVYVDLSDQDFFRTAIDAALEALPEIEASDVDVDTLKESAPICHVSTLAKMGAADARTDRRTCHSERARRKFIMLDVDFNAGEERRAEEMRSKLIALAERHCAQLLIYPTLSYPDKPRFRAVLFTKRLMREDSYYQAVSWLYGELGEDPTDLTDFSMRYNRNLPLFRSWTQADAVWSNLDWDDGAPYTPEPLDNALWKDVPKPERREWREYDSTEHECEFDAELLVTGASLMSREKIAKSYATFWPVVASIAAAVRCGAVDEDTANRMLDELAGAADDANTAERWKRDNRQLLRSHLDGFDRDPERACKSTRPLRTYTEFAPAAVGAGM